MRSPLDFPCDQPNGCGVSAGRYCDGAEPCRERVEYVEALDAHDHAKAEERRVIEEETVRRCAEWLRAQAVLVRETTYAADAVDALNDAADELSLEVLP